MQPPSDTRRAGVAALVRSTATVGCALFASALAYHLSFPPTLNPADESYLLYAAKRIFQGDVLYRDVFDFQTPGSFYYYALAYALGGVSITSARVATALLNATSCALTFVLARSLAGTAEAVLAAIAFSVLCVPVFNVASHHWMATTLALATAAVLLAPRWRDSARARPAAAGALAALAVCSQQGRGLWLVAWLAIALPILLVARTSTNGIRRLAREVIWALAGGAFICVGVLGHATWRASIQEVTYATYTWVVTQYAPYNVGKTRWAASMYWTRLTEPNTALWLLARIPTVLAIEAAWLAWSAWRLGPRTQATRACLLLLAAATAGSVLYFPDFIHVAFIAPFAFVVLAGLVSRARSQLPGARGRVATVAAGVAWSMLLTALLVKGAGNLQRTWEQAPVVFPTAFGSIAATAQRSQEISDVRQMLAAHGQGSSRLFSYPNDASMYLLVPADNPTPYALLRPRYNSQAQIAQTIAILQREPGTLVLVSGFFLQRDDPVYAFVESHLKLLGSTTPGANGVPLYELWGAGDR